METFKRVDTKRKTAALDPRVFTADERRSILAQLEDHCKSLRSVARQFGEEEELIMHVALYELRVQMQRGIREAYQAGRRSWIPPSGGATALRRAA